MESVPAMRRDDFASSVPKRWKRWAAGPEPERRKARTTAAPPAKPLEGLGRTLPRSTARTLRQIKLRGNQDGRAATQDEGTRQARVQQRSRAFFTDLDGHILAIIQEAPKGHGRGPEASDDRPCCISVIPLRGII
jgi:hypothetical protein